MVTVRVSLSCSCGFMLDLLLNLGFVHYFSHHYIFEFWFLFDFSDILVVFSVWFMGSCEISDPRFCYYFSLPPSCFCLFLPLLSCLVYVFCLFPVLLWWLVSRGSCHHLSWLSCPCSVPNPQFIPHMSYLCFSPSFSVPPSASLEMCRFLPFTGFHLFVLFFGFF